VNEKIRNVTPDEILSLSKEILDPIRITLAVVGPNPDERLLKKLLGA
jgi:predicted Zn-dependent peptidase